MMTFRNLPPENITLDLATKGKHSALAKIATRIARRTALDHRMVLRSIWRRERHGSTGIGHGIAVPHALLHPISSPVTWFTRLAPPIDFKSSDLNPVDLVFTILWPRSQAHTFLPALSQLFRFVRAPLFREELRLARSADEVMAILQSEAWAKNQRPRAMAARRVAVS
ncbi:PTS lactose transporter subunit IIB [Rhizobium leguminosarum bv. trifolii CB782]|uniref:PTS sugar transporter subunit IIA n=1 Tax=Rhizobium hidalgonense TaxID=1538159 RepID=UPI00027D2A18|nr:PTS sugar transporter subunit IIA [Rhizobium hidalgonense]AHG47454.1 PTS lactose transporter subunit IIB [Rhizobium leguminosarum bv. trifolii CB782]EJC76360.1 phosphotransferase system mannitol/fructose-specifc IIA component (Ntr-type) [Rhizobium leguminosarum bv. trifolii WSM2012]MDR9806825.1 PTS sugar transporter subunit IIA [Rhizobium hidalgonense]QKK21847.1 PTS sugar transporter subunit IIA [Rhizobium hidalgonense]QKK25706.1 PTS sugar transporter subunit IIA [Rhizobium hidalgonense]